MTWKQIALSLFCIYIVSMLGMSYYVDALESRTRYAESQLDLVYSQLPDPHETCFGE